jgi:hypothetical protein
MLDFFDHFLKRGTGTALDEIKSSIMKLFKAALCTAIFFLSSMAISFSQQLPIRPTRTISFATDEGSYMNVDISPDGKPLLFDLLGDIYTVPAEGGQTTQLTRGIALNARPVWSPDGKKIAYYSDRSGSFHLNVMDATGAHNSVLGHPDEEMSFGADPIWTPDANYIAVDGMIYGLAGGKVASGANIRRLIRFSANGRVVGIDSGRLWIYDQTTAMKTSISDELKAQTGVLSPDAHWWCYITDSNANQCLIAENLVTRQSRMLIASLIKKDPRYNPFMPSPHYSFSPDSRCIYVGYGARSIALRWIMGPM